MTTTQNATAARDITAPGKATVGVNNKTVHLAKITVTVEGDKVTDRRVRVSCGAVRYRNVRNVQPVFVAPITAEVTCTKCAKR